MESHQVLPVCWSNTTVSLYAQHNCPLRSIHDQDGELAMGVNKLITSGKMLWSL